MSASSPGLTSGSMVAASLADAPLLAVAASKPKACAHCGLDLGKHWRPQDGPFCCKGCQVVYRLIHEEGLERFYDLRQCPTTPPAELRPDSLNWLDALLEASPRLPGTSVRRLRLDLQGLHCAACIWLLERLFEKHAGAVQLRINPAIGSVDMLWDLAESDLAAYLHEVESFGYRFGPPRKGAPRRSRALMVRIGICSAAAMNVMTYSLAYYFGLASDEARLYELVGRLSFGLAALALVVGGWPFLVSAWRGLRRGIAHLDLPIAVGMVFAFAGSTWAYFVHGPDAAYFDTITIFITLMLVGRWLQERVVEGNRNRLLASGGVADLFTRRFEEGEPRARAVDQIEAGDELWIAPGDLVPVTGILLQRSATLSLDWITGEAAPVEVGPGQRVPAGAFNASQQGFRVTAQEAFSGSRLSDLIRSDSALDSEETSFSTASSVEAWWNRVASIYVLLVFAFAAAGFFVGWATSLQRAVETAVAILVVTCPCALGLGLPLGRELAHARLRDLGVLLRSDGFLDRALQVRKVVFDKTGTITRGALRLTPSSLEALGNLPAEERLLLRGMAARSNHPVSRSVAEILSSEAFATGETLPAGALDGLREIAGKGLELSLDDREIRFGRLDFAKGEEQAELETDSEGAALSVDGELRLELEFEEDLRPDAQSEIEALRRRGLAVYLFSGDHARKVRKVAEQLGLASDRTRGDLGPEAKAEAVASLGHDRTLMVGDGLNDSLSFDAALCKATPAVDRAILPQKADFYFLGDGIGAVRHALEMARHLQRVQKGNLLFAALYNAVAVALCMVGVVQPVVAAVLMPLSSITVVVLTTRRMARKRLRWTS